MDAFNVPDERLEGGPIWPYQHIQSRRAIFAEMNDRDLEAVMIKEGICVESF